MPRWDRPYRTVRELVHIHAGQPAVVLGGGTSLPEDLRRCPRRGEAVYLSANEHGALLTECDYLVAHDKIEAKLRPFGKPLVSRHMWADFRIMGSIVPSTGVETAWVARLMGCSPIYIAGMDCYAGGTYFHDADALSDGLRLEVGEHLRRWRTTLAQYPGEYVAMSDPLWTALEGSGCIRPGAVNLRQILREIAGVFVRFTAGTYHRGRWFAGASTAELPQREAEILVQQGKARFA